MTNPQQPKAAIATSVQPETGANGRGSRGGAEVVIDAADKDEVANPQRKKSMSTKPARERVLAPLELFIDSPIDILTEIASHLDPEDLLHLSHANKKFHKLVVSEGRDYFWKPARERCGEPLMNGYSEIQNAAFLHGIHCQECGRSRVAVDQYLNHRTTLCKRCFRNLTVSFGTISATFPHLHPKTMSCILPLQDQEHSRRRFGRYLIREIETASDTLTELEDEADRLRKHQSDETRNSSLNPTLFASQFVIDQQRKNAERIMSNTEFSKALSVHKVAQKVRWLDEYHKFNSRCTARLNSIKDKALEAGFMEDEFRLALDENPDEGATLGEYLVISSDPLTEEDWNDMKGSVLSALTRSRAQQVEEGAVALRALGAQEGAIAFVKGTLAATWARLTEREDAARRELVAATFSSILAMMDQGEPSGDS